MGIILFILLLIAIVVFLVRCICIVPQGNQWILEFLGKYMATWDAGLHLKIPIVMTVVQRVSVKQQSADYEPQLMKTSDGVNILVDWVVFFTVKNSQMFTYGVERPVKGIENLSTTTLLSIVGSKTFDEIYTSRESINAQITKDLDVATDSWGIKVDRVEIKNIRAANPGVNDAMEQEMIAEREKRAMILRAEGERESQVTLAQAQKDAAILHAEGVKESAIKEAEGEAKAHMMTQEAIAKGIAYVNEANPSESYMRLEAYKAIAGVAAGQATTMFIPTDLANVVSGIATTVAAGKPVLDAATKNTPTIPSGAGAS